MVCPGFSSQADIIFLLYRPINVKETKIILCADNTDILVTTENGHHQQKINRVMNCFHGCIQVVL
jgi:hypothetical protein